MISNLSKIFKFPYINIKFFLVIFILILISLISSKLYFVSLFLVLIVGSSFFGLKLMRKLNKYNKETFQSIIKLSGVFILNALIFFIFEFVVFIIGLMLYLLIVSGTSSYSAISYSYNIFSIIISTIIFICIIILELIKNVALVRYFKLKKLKVLFEFKKNIKIIFNKSFLVVILFLIGYIFMYILFFTIFSGIIYYIFSNNELLVYSINSLLLILFLFLVQGGIYFAFYEVIKTIKIK